MELYIFDSALNFQGILEGYSSLRWVRRYSSNGEFELQCGLNEKSLALLKEENIIYKKDDTEAGVITYINFKLDAENHEIIVAKGKFLSGYLNRRIALGTDVITDTAENAIRTLVNNNAVNPTDTNRKFPNLVLGANNNFPGTISYTLENKELLEDISNIALHGELGFMVNFNISDRQLVFNIYQGQDRSINQSINPKVIFDKEFENILEQEYTDSLDNYKNVAYSNSTSIGNAVGLSRYEMFADKDLDVELSKREKVTTFDSKINLQSNLKYKIDFDIGDIVTCMNRKWNVTIDARITEIEEVYEENGLSINIIFGNSIPTLIDKIKQVVR